MTGATDRAIGDVPNKRLVLQHFDGEFGKGNLDSLDH